MKLHLAAAALVAAFAFTGTSTTAEAGGLHHLCPTKWVKHIAYHHHHADKVVVKKKVYKVAKKPAKKVYVKKAPAKKPLK